MRTCLPPGTLPSMNNGSQFDHPTAGASLVDEEATSLADKPIRAGVPDLASSLGIPDEAASTMEQSYTCEFSVMCSDGTPVTYPLTPYPNRNGLTIDMSIGLIFPWKAELARKNPKVGLSYCVPTSYHDESPAVVTVRGHAAVRDTDLQANTDRYLHELIETFPGMFAGAPKMVLRQLAFYLARIWVEITPLRIHWWPQGDFAAPPKQWDAPKDTGLPISDPAPSEPATQGSSRFTSPPDWRPGFESALEALGPPALTTVDEEGWPVTTPAVSAAAHPRGAIVQLPNGHRPVSGGPACLTFHTFKLVKGSPFQENRSFTGQLQAHGDGLVFKPNRQLVSASLPNRSALMKTFYNVWRMRKRLPSEAHRRHQPTPKVKI